LHYPGQAFEHLITALEMGYRVMGDPYPSTPRLHHLVDGVILRLERTWCPLSMLFLALDVFMITRTKLHGSEEAIKGRNRYVCRSSKTQSSSGPTSSLFITTHTNLGGLP